MAVSSGKQSFLEGESQLDLIFRALSHQTRRAPFAMSLPAVSRHIRVLEKAGLVARTVDGRVHHCSLSATPLKDVELWLRQYRRFWEGTLESLACYVEADAEKQT